MDEAVVVFGPFTCDEAPYFGHMCLLLERCTLLLIKYSLPPCVGPSLHGICYEGASFWTIIWIDHGTLAWFEEGAPSLVPLWPHVWHTHHYFHYFMREPLDLGILLWLLEYFPMVSCAPSVFTRYFIYLWFSTHDSIRVPLLYKKDFLSFVTRVWKIRHIIWPTSICVTGFKLIFLR